MAEEFWKSFSDRFHFDGSDQQGMSAVVFLNEAFSDITGYSFAEVIGQELTILAR